MTVYELDKNLTQNYYTDINPLEYYNPNNLLARKAYTAVDQSLSDSIRKTENFIPMSV